MSKNIPKENKIGALLSGNHRVSICDIRHPQAQNLESDIMRFIKSKNSQINEIKRAILAEKLNIMDGAGEDGRLLDLRNCFKTLREYKSKTLQEMYAAMRSLTCVSMVEVHNIIPTVGRGVLAAWITGDNSNDAANGANYGSLGTSNTAPANGDTQLTTETFRKATSSVSQVNNVATLTNFYSAADVNGTFEEAGWHIDGTASVNTGVILSHFLTGTTVKSASESLTVESVLTIT